ncbi:WASH complex subunit 3-like [Mizuhopecten yessoensis]|uniref:WASH complex subunit 3-like n=1 Tax=Mizuhopecten yessoensis TaxID=6573 RepID=UPI000B45C891|nr:WASH complex subunit 3-like [Mizuhopecten yessoensis]
MDADGLPLVGPGVDYTKVEAIHQKRTLAFMNHFVSHTASFLNRFSCVCEEKLDHMLSRLQQLEITMNILEAKLTSIPGLENVTAPASGAPPPDAQQAPQPTSPGAPQAAGNQQDVPSPPEAEETAPPPPEEEKTDNPVSKDPRYAKYFKMLQVGVPEAAVRPKMKMEGLDPNLLSTPDAPAPAMSARKKDDSDDDDDDFSDESESDSFSE